MAASYSLLGGSRQKVAGFDDILLPGDLAIYGGWRRMTDQGAEHCVGAGAHRKTVFTF
jgi:hypothetical protein